MLYVNTRMKRETLRYELDTVEAELKNREDRITTFVTRSVLDVIEICIIET